MVITKGYVPQRGDIVWITLNPQAGHEQAGRRPAVVLSPGAYNSKVGLAILCPITNQIKGYPFEVLIQTFSFPKRKSLIKKKRRGISPLPAGLPVEGVILADQAKSLDWRARNAELICTLPPETIAEVLRKLGTLLMR